MGLATSVHELKTLVLSFHPIVVIETVEEERAEGQPLPLGDLCSRCAGETHTPEDPPE